MLKKRKKTLPLRNTNTSWRKAVAFVPCPNRRQPLAFSVDVGPAACRPRARDVARKDSRVGGVMCGESVQCLPG